MDFGITLKSPITEIIKMGEELVNGVFGIGIVNSNRCIFNKY